MELETTPAAPAALETQPWVYNIAASSMEELRVRFARLAKRAAKLGVEVPSFEVTGQHREWQHEWRSEGGEYHLDWSKQSPEQAAKAGNALRFTGAIRDVNHVVLAGVSAVKLAGWTFLATLDHELGEENTIVRAVPGSEGKLPADFRHRGNFCDQCKRATMRKATYVVQHDDGRLCQVGSTCIKDFLGHSVAGALAALEIGAMAISFMGLAEGEFGMGQREPTLFETQEFLAWTVKAIRENGWTPRSKAGIGHAATADVVDMLMRDYRAQNRG